MAHGNPVVPTEVAAAVSPFADVYSPFSKGKPRYVVSVTQMDMSVIALFISTLTLPGILASG